MDSHQVASPLNRLLNLAPLARLRAAVFGAAARLHVVRLDRVQPLRAQLRTLLGLVHRAQSTIFGRDHDFARIRVPDDFRRLVPLRTPAELDREYPEPGQVWPASPPFICWQQKALMTALALVHVVRPRSPLLAGRILWTGERHDAHPFPLLVRPSLAAQKKPVTCVMGPAGRVAAQLERMKRDGTGHTLTAVLHHRQAGFSAEGLRRLAGPGVLFMEMLQTPSAALAVEDPRHAGLRLLPEHGGYFEFVPLDQAGRLHPARLGLPDVRPGVPYEVAISAPGSWACRSGLVVAFERLAPPILRVVEGVVLPAPSEVASVTARASHPRSGGSPAALPETSVRSLWSVPADRG
jgi:hypothetical protein